MSRAASDRNSPAGVHIARACGHSRGKISRAARDVLLLLLLVVNVVLALVGLLLLLLLLLLVLLLLVLVS